MTATIEHEPDAPTAPDAAAPAVSDAKPAKRAGWRAHLGTIIAWVAIGVIIAGAVFFVFQGPVADAWYSTRQKQLISQYNAPGKHAGLGKAIALIQFPKLGETYAIAEGDSATQLRSGPGHRANTSLPGRRGNSVVLAHRRAYGGPFSQLGQLQAGDYVVVQFYGPDAAPVNGVYVVKKTYTTNADDVRPFAPSNDYRLTLVTGTGGRFSDRRVVVEAVSGNVGTRAPVQLGTNAVTPVPADANRDAMLLVVAGLGGAAIIWVAFRRRYHARTLVVVTVPLLLLGGIGLLLRVDTLLPPLR